MLTVADVYAYVNGRAPFDTQMDFDNAGLLTGAMDQPVTGIHVALDCTEGVIQEAERLGANLIVTHHPLMFHARKCMTEEDAEGRLLCWRRCAVCAIPWGRNSCAWVISLPLWRHGSCKPIFLIVWERWCA